jgi:spore coat polysaccharide biosynthesis predicted glycosyltransferase SpsG
MTGPDRELMSAADKQLFEHWRESRVQNRSDRQRAQEIVDVMEDFHAGALLLDDPAAAGAPYQDMLASHLGSWLQFDGRCSKNLRARWIVNQQPHITAENYAGAYDAKSQQILAGPRYAPIRRTFRRDYTNQTELKKIVAIFGGGDDRGMHELTIQALGAAGSDYQVTLVCGKANPRNVALARMVENVCNIDVVVDPNNLPTLLNSAGLVVTAGGTTTYELAALGLPMVIISLVDNQVAQSRAWAAMGAAVYLGKSEEVDAAMLSNAVEQLARAPVERKRLGEKAHANCDGLGARRIVEAMLQENVATTRQSTGTI